MIPTASPIDTGLIPRYVAEDMGRVLLKSFLENIRDPEKLKLYNELGNDFMERQAARPGKEARHEQ